MMKSLYDFVDPADAECVRREVEILMREFFPAYEARVFQSAFEDVEKLFWFVPRLPVKQHQIP